MTCDLIISNIFFLLERTLNTQNCPFSSTSIVLYALYFDTNMSTVTGPTDFAALSVSRSKFSPSNFLCGTGRLLIMTTCQFIWISLIIFHISQCHSAQRKWRNNRRPRRYSNWALECSSARTTTFVVNILSQLKFRSH